MNKIEHAPTTTLEKLIQLNNMIRSFDGLSSIQEATDRQYRQEYNKRMGRWEEDE